MRKGQKEREREKDRGKKKLKKEVREGVREKKRAKIERSNTQCYIEPFSSNLIKWIS